VTETAGLLSQEELTGDYEIDPGHSRLGFVARHAMVTKVRGSFEKFQGRAHLDFADPRKSSAELTVDVASIDTGNVERDEIQLELDVSAVKVGPTGSSHQD
jgi:polyisoprenoid-binding protein YceI